jgi:hypothetical protein
MFDRDAVASGLLGPVQLDVGAGQECRHHETVVEPGQGDADVAFSLAAIVDGSSPMSIGDDDHIVPILGFAEGRMRDRLLVPREGGSSVHGHVPGYIALDFASEL